MRPSCSPGAQPILFTRVVTDADGFRALGREWEELLQQSAQRCFFLGWHWTWLWWAHFAPAGATLFIVCCRDGAGALVGLAPLYTACHRRRSIVPVRELLLLGTGIAFRMSEQIDVFAKRGLEAPVAEAIAATLKGEPGWDRLRLDDVPADSVMGGHLVRAVGAEWLSTPRDRAPYIDTSQGWEHYKRTRGRSMRRNVEYYARRLARRHACAFERVVSAATLDGAIDDLVRLHQARWQAVGEPGTLGSAGMRCFLAAVAGAALQAGQLRLWRLKIDGCAEAALIGFLDNGVVHYFQQGVNPAYASEDLGTAMVALCVRDCCDDPGVQAFDFMGGGAHYKSMWARQERQLMRYEACRTNARTIADRAWTFSRDTAALVYRAAAPAALRSARRRWQQRRRLEHARDARDTS